MPVQSVIEKVTTAQSAIEGIGKRFSPSVTYFVGGREYTKAQMIALYEEQLAAIADVRDKYIAWQGALARERKLRTPVREFTVQLKTTVHSKLGTRAFPDFGWTVPRKPGPKSVKAKLAGVEKRRKNRG
jgi:hypothetical protein